MFDDMNMDELSFMDPDRSLEQQITGSLAGFTVDNLGAFRCVRYE